MSFNMIEASSTSSAQTTSSETTADAHLSLCSPVLDDRAEAQKQVQHYARKFLKYRKAQANIGRMLFELSVLGLARYCKSDEAYVGTELLWWVFDNQMSGEKV